MKTKIHELLAALRGEKGEAARKEAEHSGRFANADREKWFFNDAYRDLHSRGLIELRVFGRGRNRQAYWKATSFV